VFWVEGCEGEEPPPTTEPPTTVPPTTVPPTTAPPGGGGGGEDQSVTPPTEPQAQVLGESVERSSESLARTGIDAGLWGAVAVGLMTNGGVMAAASRKLRRQR
jgi:hypothetical protein